MRSRFFALDLEDAPDRDVLARIPGSIEENVLPCDAVVYSYADAELDKLSDFYEKDRESYMKLMNEDPTFNEKAREINGRVLLLYSFACARKPAQKYFTHSFQLENFEYEHRTFKKYEPRLSFSEYPDWSVVFDSKTNRKSLNLLAEWINKLGCPVDIQNGDGASFLLKEPLQGMLLAAVLTCLIKTRIKEPVQIRGHFGAVLWPPWASGSPST